MLVSIPAEVVEKIEAFAADCVKTNRYYALRGQSHIPKITNDIIVGKMGEWAAYELLRTKYPEMEEPDLKIYVGGRKSHSPDLTAGDIHFSIKTQTLESVKKYGMSWLMEKNSVDKFVGHHVILCMQIEPTLILIQNIVTFESMMEVQSLPKLKHLKSKIAFYYNDMLLNTIKGENNDQ